jgi:hypothetical protein
MAMVTGQMNSILWFLSGVPEFESVNAIVPSQKRITEDSSG